jgi:3'-phosphoadenosine 5'-phosphosulfate sulfotransferase (PAPS reductase)/FAD synthetase/ubiquinone/menaquinone biosynthesis C-methylase UbiE
MTLMDQPEVDAFTKSVVAQGVKIFNAALFGANEQEHVAVLLDLMKPRPGALIVDAGCGIGETARIMSAARPDLRFQLLNISAAQLAHCPPTMDRVLGDFDAMPFADGVADVVMFNYAICHSSNWRTTLREARRVLMVGGSLFINDMARLSGDNAEFERLLGGRAHEPELVEAWAREAGFALEFALGPEVHVHSLAQMIEPKPLADSLLDGVVPTVWSFRKLDDTAAAFNRHARIGFQFSGGRDSTAALFLLRPYWDRMVVYHVDTGDQFPETRAVVDKVAQSVPIVRVHSDVPALRTEHGMPSDLVPVDNTELGRMVSGRTVKLQSRYECCWRGIMQPMHERMVADGITLLVRGQRDDEYATQPLRSGQSGNGFEVLYPIQSWSGEQVTAYLKDHGLPIADFYEYGAPHGSDCMGCTAWWDDGRVPLLRRHPQAFEAYQRNMKTIRIEIDRQYAMLDT